MAEKGFGVKEINLIGASGTPTIESPNNLNLNAVNVAISTNVSIGGTLAVTGNVSVGGTLTYEDVTNIDSVGLITARNGLIVSGVSTLSGNCSFAGNNVTMNTSGSPSLNAAGTSRFEIASMENAYLDGSISHTGDITTQIEFQTSVIKLDTAGTTRINVNNSGATVTGTLTATTFSGSGASLTNLPVADSDIQVAYTVTANGSSAYRFAGNGVVSTADDPDLYLIRGQKYRFINNSGGSHPFQIREASGGTAYSTGVTNNGAASGNIDFAPTFDSPAQLVYQCTSHGGMVGNIYLKDGNGNETNVGVTTFSGLVHLNQLKKTSGTLDYLAATHNFANAAGSTNYFTVNNTDATLTGSTDGVLNLDTTDARGSFIRFKENGTSKCFVGCGEGLSLGDQDDLGLRATDNIIFRAGSSESMRLSGTRLYVNTTSPVDGNSVLALKQGFGSSGCGMEIVHNGNPLSGRDFIRFYNQSNAEAGSIEHNASTSVAFLTSSDYRLKENVVNITNGIERLKLLKPRKFNWIADPELGSRDGFLAHEVSPVIPHCISGEKDAVKEDGSIQTQTMDYSQVTPLLTAALQEAVTKIETLESEVAALKAK